MSEEHKDIETAEEKPQADAPEEAQVQAEESSPGSPSADVQTPAGEHVPPSDADSTPAAAKAPLEQPQPDSDEEQAGAGPTREGMSWCVLRVASNKEDQVREALERKVAVEGLEDRIGRILVPTEKRPAPRGKAKGKNKTVERKMYPGYVFIEMALEEDGKIDEHAWFTIKETMGVGDFIGASGKPSLMAQEDVDKMLQQVEKAQEGAPVRVEFVKGDQVKIKEGAFENFEGAIDEVLPEKGLVRVVVTIFGRATPVELEYWQVEKV
jgi:transcription termination/antitermination protein NusG